ncbi:hypothetical protein L7F22_041553 [Adiantum nelumboides]|nr:hypothetical protein [Adiantum nelumboides]
MILCRQSKVLQQLRETKAVSLIKTWMEKNCVNFTSTESLQNAVWQACCQGAAAFTGSSCMSSMTCSKKEVEDSDMTSTEGLREAIVISSRVLVDGCEQVIDALVPKVPSSSNGGGSCQCCLEEDSLHPTTRDLLAILLLALPTSTWEDIQDPDIHLEICRIFSKEELPPELQLEVEHLFEQAILVSKSCSEEF